jgi:glycosyltransferase involved in cell wall biosynthesis
MQNRRSGWPAEPLPTVEACLAPLPAFAADGQAARRPRVVCVQRRLTHYRVAFFEALRQHLAQRGVDFVLVHGQATPEEDTRHDGGQLAWALHAPCHYFWGDRLCWQDPGAAAEGADLLILPHENRLLYNLFALGVRRPARLAFWGHGRNFQSTRPNGALERFKRWTTCQVDWWFAYTDVSTQHIQRSGYPAERITTVMNACDTAPLVADCRRVTPGQLQALRARWQLVPGPLGLFIGSLHASKRIGMLLDAAAELARRVPGFQLLVVGEGPERPRLQAAAQQQPWVRPLGVLHGRDKALCLSAASIILNPGMVGLNVLDAFAAGRPLVTTDCGLHSPEIAYLRSGHNGWVTTDRLDAYVDACQALLEDEVLRRRLGRQAGMDLAHYTLPNMVSRYADGVLAALAQPAR